MNQATILAISLHLLPKLTSFNDNKQIHTINIEIIRTKKAKLANDLGALA